MSLTNLIDKKWTKTFVSKRTPMFNMYADKLNGTTIKYNENNFLSAIKRW